MNWDCYARYLASKKSVDDRALNQHVFSQLVENLPTTPLTVLEAGCGVGTMIERVLDWGLFSRHFSAAHPVSWTAVDQLESNIDVLTHRIGKRNLPESFTVDALAADIRTYSTTCDTRYDLVVAHAFLDLFDPADIVTRLFSLLKPGGWFYFTINFDGVTSFEPPLSIDTDFDQQLERRYHQTMDDRIIDGRPSGDSRSGRHLMTLIPALGGEIVAAGSSDWIVHPIQNAYPDDEAYFLHYIIETVKNALDNDAQIDAEGLRLWHETRHEQINRGLLTYITHQIDLVGYISTIHKPSSI